MPFVICRREHVDVKHGITLVPAFKLSFSPSERESGGPVASTKVSDVAETVWVRSEVSEPLLICTKCKSSEARSRKPQLRSAVDTCAEEGRFPIVYILSGVISNKSRSTLFTFPGTSLCEIGQKQTNPKKLRFDKVRHKCKNRRGITYTEMVHQYTINLITGLSSSFGCSKQTRRTVYSDSPRRTSARPSEKDFMISTRFTRARLNSPCFIVEMSLSSSPSFPGKKLLVCVHHCVEHILFDIPSDRTDDLRVDLLSYVVCFRSKTLQTREVSSCFRRTM